MLKSEIRTEFKAKEDVHAIKFMGRVLHSINFPPHISFAFFFVLSLASPAALLRYGPESDTVGFNCQPWRGLSADTFDEEHAETKVQRLSYRCPPPSDSLQGVRPAPVTQAKYCSRWRDHLVNCLFHCYFIGSVQHWHSTSSTKKYFNKLAKAGVPLAI